MNVGEMVVAGEKTDVLEKKLSHCHFVDHKFHME